MQGLITAPAHVVIKAAVEFTDINQTGQFIVLICLNSQAPPVPKTQAAFSQGRTRFCFGSAFRDDWT
ncbi:hypothetical protein [Pontibaca salina]|uniref:Uncharacterized protein n=1 Tax=Pontibaca salina TaxID=2795731 RepID=A0A934HMM0_9RHOB|nr:hypothetical protein [Pontibaca salina]MBI6630873.1 hypothetical protein [Pontibaca salina]